MIIAFILWSIVSLVFIGIGFSSRFSHKAVGFFTGVRPPQVKDVAGYNRAVSRLWFIFAFLLELSGIPLLFGRQNDLVLLLCIPGVPVLVIGIMICYTRIEQEYKVPPEQ